MKDFRFNSETLQEFLLVLLYGEMNVIKTLLRVISEHELNWNDESNYMRTDNEEVNYGFSHLPECLSNERRGFHD